MRYLDILGLAWSSLWQQKIRTMLTTMGVVFGSFVLTASLSIGHGIENALSLDLMGMDEFLRQISVHTNMQSDETDKAQQDVQVQGEMSEAKRQRIRELLLEINARFNPPPRRKPIRPLTKDGLRELATLENVQTVEPNLGSYQAFAFIDQEPMMTMVGATSLDDDECVRRLLAGRFFTDPAEHGVVVSEFLLYRWGMYDDAAAERVLGKKVRLEFPRPGPPQPGFGLYLIKPPGVRTTRQEEIVINKMRDQLSSALDLLDLTAEEKALLRKTTEATPPSSSSEKIHVEELTIVGVFRMPTKEEMAKRRRWGGGGQDVDVLVPWQTAMDMLMRIDHRPEARADSARVIVDRKENVKDLLRTIQDMGFGANANMEFLEQERLFFLLIWGAMTCVAGVALLVAALGIANTMLMSVLERTREIGIMKAVGAANIHLQLIFLIEGALIGLVGGGLGLALSWAASFPADSWLRSMISRDLRFEVNQPIFVFPLPLTLSVLSFSMLVTVLAAVYPAWRAASVDPVTALRHE